jgi:hypothetical protein
MSIKRLGGRTRCARVSLSPSKIPYGGFSPVRLQTGRQARPSSADLYAPQATISVPNVPRDSHAQSRAKCDARSWHPSPEALGSAIGYVVRPRHRLLWPHPSVSVPPTILCLRRWVFATGRAPRRSPICSARVCHRAVFRTPTGHAAALGCCYAACKNLRLLCKRLGTRYSPRNPVPRGSVFGAAKFALCYGPMTCSPCTGQDFYARAFTSVVTLLRCRV